MIGKGIFERTINGKTVGFKFGTYAAAVAEQESGMSISQIFSNIQSNKSIVMSLLHYFYGGAASYCKSKGLETPTIDVVSDWLEEIGLQDCMVIFTDSLSQPKNSEAPTQTGQ